MIKDWYTEKDNMLTDPIDQTVLANEQVIDGRDGALALKLREKIKPMVL